MLNTVYGLVLGVFTGALGAVVHAGFVDFSPVGLALGALLLGSASWVCSEWFGKAGWFVFLLSSVAVTLAFVLLGLGDDWIVAETAWVSRAWLVAAPIVATLPGLVVFRRHGEPDRR